MIYLSRMHYLRQFNLSLSRSFATFSSVPRFTFASTFQRNRFQTESPKNVNIKQILNTLSDPKQKSNHYQTISQNKSQILQSLDQITGYKIFRTIFQNHSHKDEFFEKVKEHFLTQIKSIHQNSLASILVSVASNRQQSQATKEIIQILQSQIISNAEELSKIPACNLLQQYTSNKIEMPQDLLELIKKSLNGQLNILSNYDIAQISFAIDLVPQWSETILELIQKNYQTAKHIDLSMFLDGCLKMEKLGINVEKTKQILFQRVQQTLDQWSDYDLICFINNLSEFQYQNKELILQLFQKMIVRPQIKTNPFQFSLLLHSIQKYVHIYEVEMKQFAQTAFDLYNSEMFQKGTNQQKSIIITNFMILQCRNEKIIDELSEEAITIFDKLNIKNQINLASNLSRRLYFKPEKAQIIKEKMQTLLGSSKLKEIERESIELALKRFEGQS